MRTLARTTIALVSLSSLACATADTQARSPSFAPSFSTPAESFQTTYADRGLASVSRTRVEADVVVRPDRVCVPVQVSATAPDAAVAMQLVEDAAAGLRAVPGAALRIDDIDARTQRTGATLSSSVTLRAVVEMELADEDAWARAKKVAALHRAVVALTSAASSDKSVDKEAPAAFVSAGNPEPGVRDVEQHRPALLASWTERAEALARAATVDDARLELVGCVPPAQVQVVAGTFEKVGLSLPVSCTFQVSKGR